MSDSQYELLSSHLKDSDPKLYNLIQCEIQRQKRSINLIASENFTSTAVYEALATPLTNKYSEGYPGARYYAGNQYIDEIESLCQERALETFHLEPTQWGVNVQPLSGAPANLEVYQALMKPGEILMGLALPDGGHLSHGYATEKKSISAVATYFKSIPYRVNPETGIIDYDALEENAMKFKPKVIVAGPSAYCRLIDYKRMKSIALKSGAYLLVDMAHLAGMIAAEVIPSPFEHADVISTTTHKSLRGPRGAMIFYRKGDKPPNTSTGVKETYDLEEKINFSVFPGHQGGPHNHTIGALTTALLQAQSETFKEYQKQVLKNAKAIEKLMKFLKYELVADGTDTHMILVSLRHTIIDGARLEYICEKMGIVLNRNSIPGDKSAMSPGGVRIGVPAMTSRGMKEEDFVRIGNFIDDAVKIAEDIQKNLPKDSHRLKDFKRSVDENKEVYSKYITEIQEWAETFRIPPSD